MNILTKRRPLALLAGFLTLAFLMAAGCGQQAATVENVASLLASGEELVGQSVQLTGQVEFVTEGRGDRFLLKDPSQPSGEGVLVRCAPDDFEEVKNELARLGVDHITLVGRVYRTEPPDSHLQIEYIGLAGGKLRWIIGLAIGIVALGIALVVILLLRKPSGSVEDLIYIREGQETVRRYAVLSFYENKKLTRSWFLSFDRNLSEPRITDVDIAMGAGGLLIGRENSALGFASQTFPRRIALLKLNTQSREFTVYNLMASGNLEVRPANGLAVQIPPGGEVVIASQSVLRLDEFMEMEFVRCQDEKTPAGATTTF